MADFLLDSDLCLPPDGSPLTFGAADGSVSLTLSNATATDHASADAVLSAQMIFEASRFGPELRQIALDKIAQLLNCLAFATNRKFAVNRLKHLADWTPGLTLRDALVYHQTPEWDTAEPALDQGFLTTAQRVLAMHSGEEQQSALRWYRLGLQAENLEEQFSYFWFALEICAEALKGKEKVPSKCPKCGNALLCETCEEHPLHRRYRGEAIQQLVERIQPRGAAEIHKTLQRIRHTLMHGGRMGSVADQLPCTQEQALNKLAKVTHEAIFLMFEKPDPDPDAPLELGYVENIARRTIIAAVHVKTGFGGDPNNPQIADLPDIKLDLVRTDELSG